jgi:glutaredoxin
MFQVRIPLAFFALMAALACQPGDGGSPTTTSTGPSDPNLVSIESGDVMQVYYQFVDERGRVRFVPTLDAVPSEWRDRVGFVEMSSPPPMSPGDAKRIREAKMRSMPGSSSARVGYDSDRRPAGSPEIILYGADWCGACRSAKKYMDGEGIDYIERNVDEDRWKQEMFAKAGQGGIPVFDIEGQILRGFSPQRLGKLIEDAS